MSPGRLLLSFSAVVYVGGAFLLSPLPGLSIVPLAALAGLFGGLIMLGSAARIGGVLQPNLGVAWAFGALGVLSVLWSRQFPEAALAAGSLLTALLGGTLVYLALINGVPLRLLAWAAVVAGAMHGVLAIAELRSGEIDRATGLAGNANALGVQLSILALVILAWEARPWTLTAIAVGYVIIATIVTGSRQVIFVWVALVALGWGYMRRAGWRRGVAIAAIATALAAVLALGMTGDQGLARIGDQVLLVQRFIQLGQGHDHSSSLRLDMVREGIQLWSDAPLLGRGIGQFRYLSSYNWYAHNNYIELLSGVGVTGLLLFLAQHAMLAFACVHRSRLALFRYKFVLAVTVVLLLWDVAAVSYYQKPFWIMVGILWYKVYGEPGRESRRSGARIGLDPGGRAGVTA